MTGLADEIEIDKKTIRASLHDMVNSANAVHLIYVNDRQPGFSRIRDGNNFHFLDGKKKLRDQEQLDSIKKLVIPPAWENVWICKRSNGHLQATGFILKIEIFT